jgi:aminoglycoside 2'-N-acetyltransferase I
MRIQVAHTADLGSGELDAIRALLWEVFDDMGEDDWEHSLGGMHALAWDGDQLAGHASVVMRRMIHGGRALRAGYVEAVAVREDRRRQGVGAAVMGPVEQVIAGAYDLGALGATDEAVEFYLSRGWRMWPGRLYALTPQGIVPTLEEEGGVFVFQAMAEVDLGGDLTADWRDGDVW